MLATENTPDNILPVKTELHVLTNELAVLTSELRTLIDKRRDLAIEKRHLVETSVSLQREYSEEVDRTFVSMIEKRPGFSKTQLQG